MKFNIQLGNTLRHSNGGQL